jgi:hypothetical protein
MRRRGKRDQHTRCPVQPRRAIERANLGWNPYTSRRNAVTDSKRRRKPDADPARGDAIAIADCDADSNSNADCYCARRGGTD